MTQLETFAHVFLESGTPWLAIAYFLAVVGAAVFRAGAQRVKPLSFFLLMHVLFSITGGVLRTLQSSVAADFVLAAVVVGTVVFVGCVALLLFDIVLPRVQLAPPRILQDVLVAVASVITSVAALSRSGFNLSGLIATSAVLTAVVGFSLQDVISNVAGGLALQLDDSVSVGDWLHIDQVVGRVIEIRWRHIALETNNGETILVPNSQVMKGRVSVLGKRAGERSAMRRWVYFNVDYRFQPADVIECVSVAVRAAKIEHVATEPPPNCVVMDLAESYGRYAVRYWLDDLRFDDGTDSVVRNVVFHALQRANMRLSIPAHAVFLTEESLDRTQLKTQREIERRGTMLARVQLFSGLSDEERIELAHGLRYAPFAGGEVITRQGAQAHWLYLITEGTVAIRISEGGVEREVSQLSAGDFFGEMSLLTGEPRAASAVALSDVECYRLDKATFQRVIQRRPDVAESIARELTKRRAELLAARQGLDKSLQPATASQADVLQRIRNFFGLTDKA